MLHACVLLYLAALYIRPGEIFRATAGLPVLDWIAGVSAAVAAGSMVLDLRSFWRQRIDKFFFLYCVAIVISNPATGYVGGGLEALQAFSPVIFCYLLIRLGVRSDRHVGNVIRLFVLLNVFLAVNGIIQFKTGYGIGGVVAFESEEGIRIRGSGIFNDPNDLGMTLVMALPFLMRWFSSGKGVGGFPKRLIAAVFIVAILMACFYTNSRGTMLGLAAVLGASAYRRFGLVASAGLATVALAALLAFGPSRTSTISSEEDSAQGRIQAWVAGFQMLKSSPILGVGWGRFADYHERVAHNSMVHVLGELGIVGGVAFVGMFYCFFRAMHRRAAAGDGSPPETKRIERAVDSTRSAIGMLICMCFLSRQYTVIVFVLLALGASQASLAADDEPPLSNELVAIGATTFVIMVGLYVVSRSLAMWSSSI